MYIYIYISYIYIYTYIWLYMINPGNSSSRKGHQQIWEGPIAWHMFVRKWYILYKFSGHHMKDNDICTQVWHNLQRGYRSLGRSYLASVTCTISENQCPSLNVKWGLIIPSRLINHHCPKKKSNLKTGGPPRLINRWAYPRLINHQCWNPFFYPTFFISNSIYFQLFFTFFLIIIVILQV